VEAPRGRRDEFVEPYFKRAKPDQAVVILKAREPARIMIAIGNKQENRWHLQITQRWVQQYNFYVNDRRWGTDVRGALSLSPLLGTGLPQSASLAGHPPAARRNRISTVFQRLSEL
jgi:hypothetical protein